MQTTPVARDVVAGVIQLPPDWLDDLDADDLAGEFGRIVAQCRRLTGTTTGTLTAERLTRVIVDGEPLILDDEPDTYALYWHFAPAA